MRSSSDRQDRGSGRAWGVAVPTIVSSLVCGGSVLALALSGTMALSATETVVGALPRLKPPGEAARAFDESAPLATQSRVTVTITETRSTTVTRTAAGTAPAPPGSGPAPADQPTTAPEPATESRRYRVAARTANTPDSSSGHAGFRCARDLN